MLNLGAHLGPHMVRPVEHVSGLEAGGPATQREAVGPLPTAPSTGLQQLARVIVPDNTALL